MFLSTVIPSSMLDPKQNLDMTPYQFSLPYNFVRGKNIIININPSFATHGKEQVFAGSLFNTTNRVIINIPSEVNVYETTMTVHLNVLLYGEAKDWSNTIKITCETINNIITFKPITIAGDPPPGWSNKDHPTFTLPTLLTISTIL